MAGLGRRRLSLQAGAAATPVLAWSVSGSVPAPARNRPREGGSSSMEGVCRAPGEVLMEDGAYTQFEYYDAETQLSRRVWVPTKALEMGNG